MFEIAAENTGVPLLTNELLTVAAVYVPVVTLPVVFHAARTCSPTGEPSAPAPPPSRRMSVQASRPGQAS